MIAPFTTKRKKAAATDDDDDDDDDDLGLADLILDDGDDDDSAPDDEYELDGDREAADAKSIEEIIEEIEREWELTPDEARLGRTAVTKVCRRCIPEPHRCSLLIRQT